MQKHRYKRIVTFVFYREQLIYDINTIAYVEGDIMPIENENARHQLIDIAEDGNIDRVTRILNRAHAECVEFMYPYTKGLSCYGDFQDNVLYDPSEYIIELFVHWDFSETTISLLSKLIHEYMICRVLYEWLSITNPNANKKWADKADSIKNEIRIRLNARCGRVRRTQSPF